MYDIEVIIVTKTEAIHGSVPPHSVRDDITKVEQEYEYLVSRIAQCSIDYLVLYKNSPNKEAYKIIVPKKVLRKYPVKVQIINGETPKVQIPRPRMSPIPIGY